MMCMGQARIVELVSAVQMYQYQVRVRYVNELVHVQVYDAVFNRG